MSSKESSKHVEEVNVKKEKVQERRNSSSEKKSDESRRDKHRHDKKDREKERGKEHEEKRSSSSSKHKNESSKRRHGSESDRHNGHDSRGSSKRSKHDTVNGVKIKHEPITDEDSSSSSSNDHAANSNYCSSRSSRESSVTSSVINVKKEKTDPSSSSSQSRKHAKSESNNGEAKKLKLIEASDGGFGDALLSIPTSYKSPKKKTSSSSSKHKPSSEQSRSSKDEHDSKSRDNSKTRDVSRSRETSRDTSRENSPLSLLSGNVKLEPLEKLDIASTLPEISPDNYFKPHLYQYNEKVSAEASHDELCNIMTSKNQRTKVFSGSRVAYTKLPSLYDMCIRILQENIDALEYTGGVPYDILKPVLERASAEQLYQLEHFNPYLIEDTTEHWKFHCNRDFRGKVLQEYETWRELYVRCLLEREDKLKKIRQTINLSKKQSTPLRQTKLAYVDSNFVKPPRNIARQQARHGTASSGGSSSSSSAPNKADIVARATVGGYSDLGKETAVPVAPIKPSNSGISVSNSNPLLKKKKAPLMMKALQSFKGIRKR